MYLRDETFSRVDAFFIISTISVVSRSSLPKRICPQLMAEALMPAVAIASVHIIIYKMLCRLIVCLYS